MSYMWKREERFTINRVCQHAASLMYRINECNEYKGCYLTLFYNILPCMFQYNATRFHCMLDACHGMVLLVSSLECEVICFVFYCSMMLRH